MKNIFKQGAIPATLVAESIAKHQVKTQIGGHSIFLGQVRADQIERALFLCVHLSPSSEGCYTGL